MNEWFALQTKMRYERFVGALLCQKGFETFVPVCSHDAARGADVRGAKGNQQSETVLFPGYVFARFDVLHRLPILTTPGVYAVVGHGKTPIAIPDAEIVAIQHAVTNRMALEPCSYLSLGSRVRVTKGPLTNYEGILIENRSGCRVVLSISAIQRSVRVQVEREAVVLLESERVRAAEAGLRTA